MYHEVQKKNESVEPIMRHPMTTIEKCSEFGQKGSKQFYHLLFLISNFLQSSKNQFYSFQKCRFSCVKIDLVQNILKFNNRHFSSICFLNWIAPLYFLMFENNISSFICWIEIISMFAPTRNIRFLMKSDF